MNQIRNLKVFTFLVLTVFMAMCSSNLHSQSIPLLRISFGLALPSAGLRGELISVNDSGVSFINQEFVKNNYAQETGVTISGTLKFPLEGKGMLSGLLAGSYTYFNVFGNSTLGTTIQNNVTVPVEYKNRFSVSAFSIGVEASASPESKINPFISSNFIFNFLSLSMGQSNRGTLIFSDAFRMGLNANAGMEIRMNHEYFLVISTGYNFGNLFFKSHSESFQDALEYNRDNVPIDDEEGNFYSNLSDPASTPSLVSGVSKEINWWNISLGLNILLGKSKKK